MAKRLSTPLTGKICLPISTQDFSGFFEQTAIKLSLSKGEIQATAAQQAVKFAANFANGRLNADLSYQPNEKEQHNLRISAEIEDNFTQLPPTISAEYDWQLSYEIIANKALQKGALFSVGKKMPHKS